MLVLTPEDLVVIEGLAKERTLEEDEEQRREVQRILTEGFAQFGDDDLVEEHGSRETLFRRRADWLIENIDFAGRTSEEVFLSKKGRADIRRILRGLNIPSKEEDELVQSTGFKFWRHNHAEKYNPLKSPWGHHVKRAVRTCVASYWSSRERNPVETGFSYQQYVPHHPGQEDEFGLEPYETEQDFFPEEKMILQEFFKQFQEFLKWEKPFRTTVRRGYKEYCMAAIPGEEGLKKAFVVAKGRNNFRVAPEGWPEGKTVLVPVGKIQNQSGPEGEAKTVAIPQSEVSEEKRIERTALDVYSLLRKGYQVEEIAESLRVGNSTAHNWVRHLEDLFREFWTLTNMIPEELKYLAVPTYECSACGRIHHSFHASCLKCQASMEGDRPKLVTIREGSALFQKELSKAHLAHQKGEFQKEREMYEQVLVRVRSAKRSRGKTLTGDQSRDESLEKILVSLISEKKVRLDSYPWNKVRGTQDIATRAAKYKSGMTIQRCSI